MTDYDPYYGRTPIDAIAIVPGGLVLTVDGGTRIRPVPWRELSSVASWSAGDGLWLWYAPTPEEYEQADRENDLVRYGAAGVEPGAAYWPSDDAPGFGDMDGAATLAAVAAMREAIMAAWRAWAADVCAAGAPRVTAWRPPAMDAYDAGYLDGSEVVV